MFSEEESAVVDDLSFLTELVKKPSPTRAELRRASATLNLLLIDEGGLLLRLAKQRGIELTILAPSNAQTVRRFKGNVDFYMLGNATVCGVTLASIVVAKQPIKEVEPPEAKQLMGIMEFRQQVCGIWMGCLVTREDVVKFVANKLGGKHFGTKPARLVEIALTQLRKKAALFTEQDFAYFELLSTARFLVESDAIITLSDALQKEI